MAPVSRPHCILIRVGGHRLCRLDRRSTKLPATQSTREDLHRCARQQRRLQLCDHLATSSGGGYGLVRVAASKPIPSDSYTLKLLATQRFGLDILSG